MNIYLLLSSALTVVLVLAHSILGELKLFACLREEALPPVKGIPMMWNAGAMTKQILRFIWHIASLFGLALAAIMIYFSQLPAFTASEVFVLKIISASLLSSGLLALILSKGSHLGWILFFAAALLCILPGEILCTNSRFISLSLSPPPQTVCSQFCFQSMPGSQCTQEFFSRMDWQGSG